MPEGLAGLREATPALLVHALTFFAVGTCWIFHMRLFALKPVIGDRMIPLNLLALFCTTMLPFGALIAAENPLGSLGPFMLAISLLAYTMVIYVMGRTDKSKLIGEAHKQLRLDRRIRVSFLS